MFEMFHPRAVSISGIKSMFRHTASFSAVAAGLMAAVSLLNAQEVRATLGGRVTDSQGVVVPNAAVAVIS
jgi:hypothetical protein